MCQEICHQENIDQFAVQIKNVCALNMKSLINPYIDFHPLIATINVKINQENVVGEMLITYMKLKEFILTRRKRV